MPLSTKPRLISFKLCPYVQRSVITLLKKGVEFDITYIDLQNKPDWFLAISPFGRVPVLSLGDEVLFESAVINEYLDEVTPPPLMPGDPLIKAKNRSWIEFGSGLLGTQFQWSMSKDDATFSELAAKLGTDLAKLEPVVKTPFFNGAAFSLVDAAYAPLFMRLELLNRKGWISLNEFPKIKAWKEALLKEDSVKKSVVADFEELFWASLRERSPFVAGKV